MNALLACWTVTIPILRDLLVWRDLGILDAALLQREGRVRFHQALSAKGMIITRPLFVNSIIVAQWLNSRRVQLCLLTVNVFLDKDHTHTALVDCIAEFVELCGSHLIEFKFDCSVPAPTIPFKIVRALSVGCSMLESLTIDGFLVDASISLVFLQCKRLQRIWLNVPESAIPEVMSAVVTYGSALRHLCIPKMTKCEPYTSFLYKLESIHLRHCDFRSENWTQVITANLRELSVKELSLSDLTALGTRCPKLEHIAAEYRDYISGEPIVSTLAKFPQLHTLLLASRSSTFYTVKRLLSTCPSLRRVFFGGKLSDALVRRYWGPRPRQLDNGYDASGGVNGECCEKGIVELHLDECSEGELSELLQIYPKIHAVSFTLAGRYESSERTAYIPVIAASWVRCVSLRYVRAGLVPYFRQLHDMLEIRLEFCSWEDSAVINYKTLSAALALRNPHLRCLALTNLQTAPSNVPALVAHFPQLEELTLTLEEKRQPSAAAGAMEVLKQAVRVICPRIVVLELRL